MKLVVMMVVSLVSAFAMASGPVTPKSFVCDGEGMDYNQNYRTVVGAKKPTIKLAQDDAVATCTAMRLMGCIAKNCRQTTLARQPEANGRPWWCTADGYDSNMQRRQISGDKKATEKEARQSALRTCNGLFMGCSVRSCFNI